MGVPRTADQSFGQLERLTRRETAYWLLSSALLILFSGTVILQFLTSEDWIANHLIQNEQYRRTLAVGLPGLVIVFCLYITAKRREISRLKITLFNQQALLQRLEERTNELETTLVELRRVNNLKDMLLSTVSHELKTPLTSIHSISQILLNYGDKDPGTTVRFYHLIHQETKRLSGLVNNLLDFAKIESGNLSWDVDDEDPKEILHSALAVTGVLAQERGLALREEVEDDLPLIRVDRDRIAQVITNLIGNAIKFTPEKGIITVGGKRVLDREKREMIRVSVRDTGPGVPKEEAELIFDWFHQAPSPGSKKPKGTGLGLAISKQIVEHFGGSIWVESEPGKGSEFIFTIPVRQAPTPEELQETQVARA